MGSGTPAGRRRKWRLISHVPRKTPMECIISAVIDRACVAWKQKAGEGAGFWGVVCTVSVLYARRLSATPLLLRVSALTRALPVE